MRPHTLLLSAEASRGSGFVKEQQHGERTRSPGTLVRLGRTLSARPRSSLPSSSSALATASASRNSMYAYPCSRHAGEQASRVRSHAAARAWRPNPQPHRHASARQHAPLSSKTPDALHTCK